MERFRCAENRSEAPGSGPMPPAVVRGFSGHWMVFYAGAFALFSSALHHPGWDGDRPDESAKMTSQ